MKKHSLNVAIGAALVVIGCLLPALRIFGQNQPPATEVNPELAEILTNAPPPGFATRLDYLKSFTNEKNILDAYHAGKLSKEEAMLALSFLGDKVSMDTYGKVVDQYGQPVVDAKVQANVDTSFGDSTDYHSKTDVQGLFHFLGLHGQGLGIELQKEGYYFDYMLASAQRPGNYLPAPSNPMVLTMWKLHGAEPMKHFDIVSPIPCDGTPARFDLLTGKKSTNGDLTVSLTRNPLNIDPMHRDKPFNWSVTFEVTNGGLVLNTNLYPYEAPAEGYQSKMTFDFQTNSPIWTVHFTPSLYFKARNGQVYGRITVNLTSNFQPPPTPFSAKIYANPAGSRNLEYEIPK